MYFDGSLNINGASAGILFISPDKDKLRYVLRILFPASNNVAEYEACLHDIRLAVKLGVKRLYVHGDSALVINQLNKEWDTTHEKMDLYCKEIRKWESNFYGIEYIHMVRDRNQAADALSKIGSSRAQIPQGVFVQDIHTPSVGTDLVDKSLDETMLVDDTPPTTSSHDWRIPFIKYLLNGSGFQDKMENKRLIRRSKNYILVNGKLMRKNASSEVLLKCISQDDGIKLLEDIHAGSCGNHAASRTLVRKVFRAGFYWPTAVADAEKLIRHCEGCQFFAKLTHVPAHEIQTILSSWPFAYWGLDMIGPFKPAPGNFKFVFALIDKFSKWIEYMPLVKATSEKAVEFLNQIIHRFGVPNSIITDLGTQFTGTTF